MEAITFARATVAASSGRVIDQAVALSCSDAPMLSPDAARDRLALRRTMAES